MSLRDTLTGAIVMAPMTKGSNLPYRRLVRRVGRARARERDGRRAAAEAAAARRVRADPARAGRAVLRRAARRQPARGNGVGRGARRSARRRLRRSQSRLPDRSLHAQGPGRRARPPAESRPPHRRGDARGGEGSGDREDSARLERRQAQLPRCWRARPSTAARRRSPCTAARAKRAIAIPPTGTRSPRSRQRVPVPVVGNGDLLFPHEIAHRLASSGCAGVMIARGALIKPWMFREAVQGYRDITAEERLTIYRRYVELGRAHWRIPRARTTRTRRSTSTAARGCASSSAGTSASGAAMRRSGRTAPGRRCSSASRASVPRSPLEALLARQTTRRSTT